MLRELKNDEEDNLFIEKYENDNLKPWNIIFLAYEIFIDSR